MMKNFKEKPLNMAIMGLGDVASHMAHAISLVTEVKAYGAASRDENRAKEFANKYGFEKHYGSYRDMLDDPQVDLVYVAVPHVFHSDYAKACIQAGKSVLVEKPFAPNKAMAEPVLKLAEEKGVFCGEGLWTAYLPVIGDLQELMKGNLIGEVKMLTGEIGFHLEKERLRNPDLAGGALLDVGVYLVGLANRLFGYDIEKVTADGVMTPEGCDETGNFSIRYKSGKMASFHTSMETMSTGRGTLWGTKGYADIDNMNRLSKVTVFDNDRREIACYENPPAGNTYYYQLKGLLRNLEEGNIEPVEVPHEETLRRLEIMDKIRAIMGLEYPFEK